MLLMSPDESIWLADCGNYFFCEIQQSMLLFCFVFVLNINFWESSLGKKLISSSMLTFYLDSGPKYILKFLMAVHWRLVFLHTIQLLASFYRQPKALRSENRGLILWTENSTFHLKIFFIQLHLSYPNCHQSAAINCVFHCCHFLFEKSKPFFFKVKCNLAFQVYMTDKFILIC